MDTVEEAAALLAAHWELGGAGVVLAQPIDEGIAIAAQEIEPILAEGTSEAAAKHIRGPELTPFLLSYIGRVTSGRSVAANRALIVANAQLAARVACAATRS